ncbi:hypothetical protein HYV31_03325 [candidate division WWE3 bacterium]|nr:hypothetical protein [candidate division WWE3 bacterium]
MFVPEYSITSAILKNIATIEYGRALIENTPILPHWEKQLIKESKIKIISNTLGMDGVYANPETIKKYLDGLETTKIPEEIRNFIGGLKIVEEINQTNEVDEKDLLALHKIITEGLVTPELQSRFRNKKYINHPDPQEILAQVVGTFDWFNSLDSKETSPILVAGIIYGKLLSVFPFENFNFSVANLISRISRRLGGYSFKNYVALEETFFRNRNLHLKILENIKEDEFTEFLEFYTQAFASEVANMKEKVLLLARDTKVAKASGTLDLTPRQSRIVEYLQDYGILQNKDFGKLFEGVSEDSVLRDLKTLLQKDIVVKKGSTKSSRYELK